eukprot:4531923-Pyramimonas_sp.AAC.1
MDPPQTANDHTSAACGIRPAPSIFGILQRPTPFAATPLNQRQSTGCPSGIGFTEQTSFLFRGVSEADSLKHLGAIFEHSPSAPG